MASKSGTSASGVRMGPPDGGWGWVVVFASFWINGAIFSILNSSGVLYVKLKETFAGTTEEVSFVTSWVGSVAIGTTFLLSPVASVVTDRFGVCKTAVTGGFVATVGLLLSSYVKTPLLLYLTYGVLLGAGGSLAYTPSLVVLGRYFRQRLGLANGCVAAGSSLFTMILPLLLNYLLNELGLAATFRILALLMSTAMLSALAFRPLKQPTATPLVIKPEVPSLINTSNWRNKRYLLWTMAIPLALFGYFVPYVHLVQLVQDILPSSNGATLVTCIGATSGLGRLFFGKLADHPNVNPIFLQQMAFAVIGTTTMLLVAAKSMAVLVILCLFLGLADGCFISLIGPIAFELVGQDGASQAIGFLLGLCAVPLTVGPPVAGYLYDHLGNYTLAFMLAGIPPILGALMMFAVHRIPRQSGTAHLSHNPVEEVAGRYRSCGRRESYAKAPLLEG